MPGKRNVKGSDGKYHINGKVYELLNGSRAQVYHQTAYKTTGGLLKKDLTKNKQNRIVSKKKQVTAKKERRLQKHGYTAKKGKFGAVKLSRSHSHSPKRKKTRKRSRRTRRRTMG